MFRNFDYSLVECIFMFLLVLAACCVFASAEYFINKKPKIGWSFLLVVAFVAITIVAVPDLLAVVKDLPWREAHR